jgi:hypothetical protein
LATGDLVVDRGNVEDVDAHMVRKVHSLVMNDSARLVIVVDHQKHDFY